MKTTKLHVNAGKIEVAMIRYCLTVLWLLLPCMVHGDELAGYFSRLESQQIATSGNESVFFHYDRKSCEILGSENNELSDKYGVKVIEVAKVTLRHQGITEEYLITYDSGMDIGPNFKFHRLTDGNKELLGVVKGTELYWQGRKILYASGRTHAMYEKKRKYLLQDGKIMEVDQPFNYVGLEGQLRKNIVLYASTKMDETVGVLPQGAPVTVLLEKNDFYLIKTTFGLLGWIRIEKDRNDSVISGLYYLD